MDFLLGLVRLIPWWVWPVLGLAGWGYYEQQRADHYKTRVEALEADIRAQASTADEVSRLLKMSAARSKGERDVEMARIDRRRADLQRMLNDRPERRPEAATEACKGGTGAGLSRPDGVFLAGEAARANGLRAALKECYAWVDEAEAAINRPPP